MGFKTQSCRQRSFISVERKQIEQERHRIIFVFCFFTEQQSILNKPFSTVDWALKLQKKNVFMTSINKSESDGGAEREGEKKKKIVSTSFLDPLPKPDMCTLLFNYSCPLFRMSFTLSVSASAFNFKHKIEIMTSDTIFGYWRTLAELLGYSELFKRS